MIFYFKQIVKPKTGKEKEIEHPAIPSIPEVEKIGWVGQLLAVIQALLAIIQQLKDEIGRLNKRSPRPAIRPSTLPTESPAKRQPGQPVNRKKKTAALVIHETVPCPPQDIPVDARIKCYSPFVVQDIEIKLHNTRYVREVWQLPDGSLLSGQLPAGVTDHFGPEVKRFVVYQHFQNHVPQDLVLNHLHDLGIQISAGQLNRLLIENKNRFHQEKADILAVGLAVSGHVHTDDTGARHQGRNGFATVLGNNWFT